MKVWDSLDKSILSLDWKAIFSWRDLLANTNYYYSFLVYMMLPKSSAPSLRPSPPAHVPEDHECNFCGLLVNDKEAFLGHLRSHVLKYKSENCDFSCENVLEVDIDACIIATTETLSCGQYDCSVLLRWWCRLPSSRGSLTNSSLQRCIMRRVLSIIYPRKRFAQSQTNESFIR